MIQIRQRLQILIRLMWLLCSITVVIAASLVVMALRLSFQRTVDARKFVLRDSVGRVRGELSVDAASNASLFFLDSLGRKKAVLN